MAKDGNKYLSDKPGDLESPTRSDRSRRSKHRKVESDVLGSSDEDDRTRSRQRHSRRSRRQDYSSSSEYSESESSEPESDVSGSPEEDESSEREDEIRRRKKEKRRREREREYEKKRRKRKEKKRLSPPPSLTAPRPTTRRPLLTMSRRLSPLPRTSLWSDKKSSTPTCSAMTIQMPTPSCK